MASILLVGKVDDELARMVQALRRHDHDCHTADDVTDALATLESSAPDVVVVSLLAVMLSQRDMRDLLQACGGQRRIPTMALLAESQLNGHDVTLGFDDFQLYPARLGELELRITQAMLRLGKLPREDQDVIRCGDLVMDTNRYEVYVAGHPVELTYKEFELLRFLATNQDKVFTREVLLNRVWGYDYYGGARTVDVHIRRLRSKIEDKDHAFIETVRNVGYRFRPGAGNGRTGEL